MVVLVLGISLWGLWLTWRHYYWQPALKKAFKDRQIFVNMTPKDCFVYAETYGCRFKDPNPIFNGYIFKRHAPLPLGIFFSYLVLQIEDLVLRERILRLLVDNLLKQTPEYRRKFIGGAKMGKPEHGGDAAKGVGKTLWKMLDQDDPQWRGEE